MRENKKPENIAKAVRLEMERMLVADSTRNFLRRLKQETKLDLILKRNRDNAAASAAKSTKKA